MPQVAEDFYGLARRARTLNPSREVGYREDGSLLLALGSAEAGCPIDLDGLPLEPRVVHYHPGKGWTLEQVLADLQRLKQQHPDCRLHGLSPAWLRAHAPAPIEALRAAGLDSFSLFTGELTGASVGAAQGWEECLQLDIPCQASFTYGPSASAEQLRDRLRRLHSCTRLECVLPLPLAVGDRVVLPGATTAGIQDLEVLATCGCELPGVPVRTSWAALGWKIGQATVAFGSNQLSGWGLEELLVYSSRTRPASVVGRAEVLAGMLEARRSVRECS